MSSKAFIYMHKYICACVRMPRVIQRNVEHMCSDVLLLIFCQKNIAEGWRRCRLNDIIRVLCRKWPGGAQRHSHVWANCIWKINFRLKIAKRDSKKLEKRAQIVISCEKWWHMRNRNAAVWGKDSTKTKKQKQQPNHREWYKWRKKQSEILE